MLSNRPFLVTSSLLFGSWLLASPTLQAQSNAPNVPDPSVEAEQQAFKVPDGLEVNLWAAEPLLRKPVQMNWDAQGRLWVVCSTTYPQIKPGDEAIDQIVILEDTDGDGKADKSTLFAEDLHIPTAVIPADGGCYVANSTEILFLKDTDGDGKADFRQTVLSGFGTEDTHHLIHTLRYTPESMLSFNQSIYIHSHVETPYGMRRLMGGGIWNWRPETRRLEIFSKGLVNPWGTEYDRWGQAFATDGAGGEGINYVFPNSVFVTSPGAKRIIRGLNPGQPKHCGLEIIDDPHFPEDWQGSLVTCDFRGNRINRFQVTPNGSGYTSKQTPDVLASTHRGFRPIDIRTGPDGALYVGDWFNPIIQHGEVDFRDPRRDRVNGRIWRITAKGRPLSEKTDFTKMSTAQLVEQLKSPRRWNREFAKQTLRSKDRKEATEALTAYAKEALKAPASDTATLQSGLEAVWGLEAVNQYSPELVTQLIESPLHHLRSAGLRILTHHLDETANALALLEKAVGDEHPQVRLWALGGLNLLYKPEALPIALRVLDKPMDDNLDFLLELTCREQAPSWMPFALGQEKLAAFESLPPKHLIYALKSTGSSQALGKLFSALESGKLAADDQAAVIQMSGDLADAGWIKQMVKLSLSQLQFDRVAMLDSVVRASQRTKGAPDYKTDTAKALMEHENPAIAQRGNLLAGLWKVEPARKELEQRVLAAGSTPELRSSAVQGITYLGGAPSREFLATLITGKQDEATKTLAINGLVDLSPQEGARHAVAFLATVKNVEEARPILNTFLKNKQLPAVLAKELEGKSIPEIVAAEGIRLASSKGMANLIEPALKKAGNVRQMDKPLSAEELNQMVAKVQQQGDAARGEKIYRRQQLLCISCHAIGETGGLIGPNMVSLGASAPVDYIIEALLEPSKKIKEGYHMTMITTKDGQIVAGAIAQDGGDEIVVRDAANQLHKVPKANIAQNTISPVSMMPPGLTASLREDEFLDLVKFLAELGREGAYKTQPNQYIRTWRYINTPVPQSEMDPVRHEGLQKLNDRSFKAPWGIIFSLVNGDVPVGELTTLQMHPWHPKGVLQADLEMAAAGKVKLKLSHAKGIYMSVGDKVIQEVTEELTVDLPAGKTTLSILIGKEAGDVSNFRVEILSGNPKVVTTL